jgi:periplasmic protein CpxP/Spy
MFMIKKIFIVFTAAIAAGGILFAAGCGHRSSCRTPEKKAEWIVNKMKNKLDLSGEQVTEVNKIKDEILARQNDFKALHEGFYENMLKETRRDKFDVNAVNQLFAEKEIKFKELRSFMISETAKFHAILTPEQREKIAKKMEEHHEDNNN